MSATFTVKLAVPLAVGVPLICPVEAVNVSPGGKLPLVIDQEYGAVPPVALKVAEYGKPATPLGKEVVATTSAVG